MDTHAETTAPIAKPNSPTQTAKDKPPTVPVKVKRSSARHQGDLQPRPLSDLKLETEECERFGYYLHKKFLGQGNYATVYLAVPKGATVRSNYKLRLMQRTGEKVQKVAIKIVNVETCSKSYITKFLPREVATMSINFEHPNIIKLIDFFVSEKRVYIVMEYAECGDLLRYVNRFWTSKKERRKERGGKKKEEEEEQEDGKADDDSKPEGISEEHAKVIFRHVMAGIRHIHSNDVAHRDLKFENILLGRNNVPKLSDFGFAIKRDEEEPLHNTHCGSYAYASPEILRKQQYDGKKSDIWSLGVMLFGLVQGFLPFKETSAKAVLQAMKKTLYLKPHVSMEYKMLMKGLLKKTPDNRMTAEEILKQPWLLEDASDQEDDDEQGFEKGRKRRVKLPSVPPHRPNKLDKPEYVAECIQNVIKIDLSTEENKKKTHPPSPTRDPRGDKFNSKKKDLMREAGKGKNVVEGEEDFKEFASGARSATLPVSVQIKKLPDQNSLAISGKKKAGEPSATAADDLIETAKVIDSEKRRKARFFNWVDEKNITEPRAADLRAANAASNAKIRRIRADPNRLKCASQKSEGLVPSIEVTRKLESCKDPLQRGSSRDLVISFISREGRTGKRMAILSAADDGEIRPPFTPRDDLSRSRNTGGSILPPLNSPEPGYVVTHDVIDSLVAVASVRSVDLPPRKPLVKQSGKTPRCSRKNNNTKPFKAPTSHHLATDVCPSPKFRRSPPTSIHNHQTTAALLKRRSLQEGGDRKVNKAVKHDRTTESSVKKPRRAAVVGQENHRK